MGGGGSEPAGPFQDSEKMPLLTPVGMRVPDERQFTLRAVFVGLLIGVVLCFSNTYFGLQTGWVTTGSLPAALLGYAVMKVIGAKSFSAKENLTLQTVAVATATMPLAAGFVGVLVALMDLGAIKAPGNFHLFLWTASVCTLGVFVAVPMRRQLIVREKLKFPTGTATATMIKMLHGHHRGPAWQTTTSYLLVALTVSAGNFLLSYFIPLLSNMPILMYLFGSWGVTASRWGWTWRPTFSYVGQGMIMGTNTALSAGLGAVIGWSILGPLARAQGWAPGTIMSFGDGAQGWILWVSLSVMTCEGISSALISGLVVDRSLDSDAFDRNEDASDEDEVPSWLWRWGILVSSTICIAINAYIFRTKIWQLAFAVVIAALVTLIALRSMGKTDYNPVSGMGKISQILFLLVRSRGGHRAVIDNLVAGAVAEAGATQAGDLMQDLKAGYLLGASSYIQFKAQMIGSIASVFVSLFAFDLYRSLYTIPGKSFPVPASAIWRDMSELLNEGIGSLAPSVLPFVVLGGALGILLSLAQAKFPRKAHLIPSGVALAIGMYLPPYWTIPRVIGGLVVYHWKQQSPRSHASYAVVVASGFIVGEGVLSIVTAALHATGVPPLSCWGCSKELIDLGVSLCTGCEQVLG